MTLFRLLYSPIGIFSHWKDRRDYLNSGEPKKIKAYKNIHKGERCFIVGNGPSLTIDDLNSIRDEISFASNRIFAIFEDTEWRPSYYVGTDKTVIHIEFDAISKMKGVQKFLNYSTKKRGALEDCVYICSDPFYVLRPYGYFKSYIKEDISDFLSNGETVTFTMIQLAIYMGVKEIYLLGQDFDMPYYKDRFGIPHKTDAAKAHFDKGDTFKRTYLNRDSNLYAFQQAKDYCDSNGVVIKNATRGGKLEVFERIQLESILVNV